jgi:hypothetical protein
MEVSPDLGGRKVPTVPLPRTRDEFERMRMVEPRLTLNDHVNAIHSELWERDETYMEYLDAVYDSEAVEGSLAADNIKAAEVIREYARKNGVKAVANKKLATIVKALNVVLRRYHASRKERATTLEGKPVILDGNGE